jgi:hypothetical protein
MDYKSYGAACASLERDGRREELVWRHGQIRPSRTETARQNLALYAPEHLEVLENA